MMFPRKNAWSAGVDGWGQKAQEISLRNTWPGRDWEDMKKGGQGSQRKTRRVLHCEETSVLRKEEIDHSTDWFQEVTLNESWIVFIGFSKKACRVSQVAQMVKYLPAKAGDQETQVWSLGWEDPLEKEMATHSSILTWRIPWTEEPNGLQSMGSQRVRHSWTTKTFIFIASMHWQEQV